MVEQQKYTWREIDRVEEPGRGAGPSLLDFGQTHRRYDEATAREQASRCVQCPNANCITACPMELPIPQLLALTAEGQFKEAADLIFTTQSLPEFFAHVCVESRLCEAGCVLGARSEPVPIGAISRFLIDYGWQHGVTEPPVAPWNGQRALVVGSGICCLVAADALSRLGYAVTIKDSAQKPGGRLMNGMPGFRVDRMMIEYRVQLLKKRGVRFHLGTNWGEDVTLGELRRAFDAVFIGLGRTHPTPLPIPGGHLNGVHQAYPFVLQKTSEMPLVAPPISVTGKRVLVLGGGETAMDALRVALRCGAREATCVYRRDEASLPANPRFYHEAVEEGAHFQFLSQPVAVLADQDRNVAGLHCARTRLEGQDASGRGVPTVIPGSGFDLPAEAVLVAYGFTPPTLPASGGFEDLAVDHRGCLTVDSKQMTNLPGVFAAGSIVRGAVPLADIVLEARQAAASVDQYLTARRPRRPGS